MYEVRLNQEIRKKQHKQMLLMNSTGRRNLNDLSTTQADWRAQTLNTFEQNQQSLMDSTFNPGAKRLANSIDAEDSIMSHTQRAGQEFNK